MAATQESPASHALRTPIGIAIVGFTLILLCALPVIYTSIQSSKRNIVLEMGYWASAFSTRLEGRLEANLAVGYGLEAQISVLGALDQQGLEVVVERLLKDTLNIRHIALAPDLVVNAIHPMTGNEAALGLDYRQHPEQRDMVLSALREHQVRLAGPLDLVQGGQKQLIARIPVYLMNDQPWGIVSLVIDFQSLLDHAGFNELQQKYRVALRRIDDRGRDAQSLTGNPELFNTVPQLHSIAVPGGQWQLAIAPHGAWSGLHRRLLWSFFFTLCLGLTAGSALFYLRRYALQRESHVQQLEGLAATDSLTQLDNRYQFNSHLEQLIEESERNNGTFTVLFIDLDHFKDVNDSLGHRAGDQLLITIAGILRACVRSYDLLCRLSGDEFIVVLKGVNQAAEIERRGRLISSRIAKNCMIQNQEVNVTCSIGVAVYPQDGIDAASLIQHADLAMYEGKRSGRNALYFFSISMRNEADRYLELSAAMRNALHDHEFEVYYQPIYDVKLRAFTCCEALCRWFSAERSSVSPGEFIPVAEQSGLICELGNWITEQVLICGQTLARQGCDIRFAINRSPQEFASKQHTQQLVALCQRYQTPPGSITLEITESLLMSDQQNKTQNLSMLKTQGFRFAIDDFGTGYSALNYLRRYPVNSLKIDKSFIAELGHSKQADTLVKVILQMAQSLNITVVAEGVETQAQLDFLEAENCDYIQGFYLAKPMPEKAFIEFVMAHKLASGL